MAQITFENYLSLVEMKATHPGQSPNVATTILGPDYPTTEDYRVYKWDYWSTATPDDDEVVESLAPDPGSGLMVAYGRWLKVNLDTLPQINADWTASTGVSQILHKPTLATVATSGSYTDLTNKPSIPAAQVNADWNSVSGLSQILNKPTVAGALVVGSPNARSLTLATAYQATDTSKPAVVTINLNSTAGLTLAGGTTIVGEVRIGSANTVATGASGTAIGSYKNSLTGTLVVGLAVNTEGQQTITIALPAGWYFAVRQTSGSGLTVVSAFDQAINN